jgi:ATP-dependent Lhr-like helicase
VDQAYRLSKLLAGGGDPGAGELARAAAVALAATDPANSYGAALPWPAGSSDGRRALGRAAGAYVVPDINELRLYSERGGRVAVHRR